MERERDLRQRRFRTNKTQISISPVVVMIDVLHFTLCGSQGRDELLITRSAIYLHFPALHSTSRSVVFFNKLRWSNKIHTRRDVTPRMFKTFLSASMRNITFAFNKLHKLHKQQQHIYLLTDICSCGAAKNRKWSVDILT